jgi:hypothetical protein
MWEAPAVTGGCETCRSRPAAMQIEAFLPLWADAAGQVRFTWWGAGGCLVAVVMPGIVGAAGGTGDYLAGNRHPSLAL